MPNALQLKADYKKYTLDFKFDAGTSRGVLKTKDSYFIKVYRPEYPNVIGTGEAGPLPKLSMDDLPQIEEVLKDYIEKFSQQRIQWSEKGILEFARAFFDDQHPSIRFAFETALLDLYNGGQKKILENDFYQNNSPIPINGLIWMGDYGFMESQIEKKLSDGFSCIKMKIGAIHFEREFELLEKIRKRFTADDITLRVDANGAFPVEEAMGKLEKLAELDLHSIEQPIKAGQWKEMGHLCQKSPVPIALDEELIGVTTLEKRKQLLDNIHPPYIILKPTLLGGIGDTREWISLAEERGIGWWMTSALESNIGLNSIAQLTSSFQTKMPQGLGTGQLYHNNIPSPLKISKGEIFYDKNTQWGDWQ
ncbi:o-succinylbenzoate synthase [Echinicola jeungdonensis]|uniref:O-succinylbenzoate synthase n=1 Tax=Echinicola jeungdonensis TaxID=709343 RepID=A0ABV5J867_9BACT|nr:o-succinylbenzoate synthase [Echinicola jeungdonensis]MDN3671012.1 o-succinylbenzoate synthase [Echinicola jeungdonensis]